MPEMSFSVFHHFPLDMELFKQCMESGQEKEIVDADIAEGLRFGIDFTPALFFNGHFIERLSNAKQLQHIIDLYFRSMTRMIYLSRRFRSLLIRPLFG